MPTSVLVRDPPRTKDSSLPIFKGAVLVSSPSLSGPGKPHLRKSYRHSLYSSPRYMRARVRAVPPTQPVKSCPVAEVSHFFFSQTSYSGIAEDPPIPSLAPEVGINQLNNPSRCHSPPSSIVAQQELEDLEMAKKRRSLQALLIPSRRNSIIPSPDGSPDARMRSRSNFEEQQTIYYTPHIETETVDPKSPTVTVEQSSDWLDEDPFANLSQPAPPIRSPTAATVLNTISRPVSPSPALKPAEPKQPPRSPLTSTSEARRGFASQRSVPNSPRPTLAPLSPRVRPATTRPAFAPRPSLPSLSTLATMNVVIPKKVCRRRTRNKSTRSLTCSVRFGRGASVRVFHTNLGTYKAILVVGLLRGQVRLTFRRLQCCQHPAIILNLRHTVCNQSLQTGNPILRMRHRKGQILVGTLMILTKPSRNPRPRGMELMKRMTP